MKTKFANFRIPEETYNRVHNLSQQTGRSISYYLREALNKYLDDLENIYLAEKRLEDVKAGRSRTYSFEEANRDLGLDS